MAEYDAASDDNAKPTVVGYVLTSLTVAVIFGVAIPIVQWRDPVRHTPLPTEVAIAAPFIVGAAFFGIVSVLLRLVGLPVWSKSETEESDSSNV